MEPTSTAAAQALLESIPDAARKADAQALAELMQQVTGEPPVLWGGGIVGFGSYHYRYGSGHSGDAPLAGFASRKPHLVVYLIGGYEDRHGKLLEKLGKHKTGKGCLYLKRLSDVDMTVLRELVDRSVRVHRGVDRSGV